MERLPYSADVTHCSGAGHNICRRCYRYLLLRKWETLPASERGVILLLPGIMRERRCSTFYDVERVDKGFYRRNDKE